MVHETDFIDAIRSHVCTLCKVGDDDGPCNGIQRDVCTIERFFPQIMEVARTVKSERIEDYVSALRIAVCAICRPDGMHFCSLRDSATCTLDRYFVLIVEAINQVTFQKR